MYRRPAILIAAVHLGHLEQVAGVLSCIRPLPDRTRLPRPDARLDNTELAIYVGRIDLQPS